MCTQWKYYKVPGKLKDSFLEDESYSWALRDVYHFVQESRLSGKGIPDQNLNKDKQEENNLVQSTS